MDLFDVLKKIYEEGKRYKKWLKAIPMPEPPDCCIFFNDLEVEIETMIRVRYNIPLNHDYYDGVLYKFIRGEIDKQKAVKEFESYSAEDNEECDGSKLMCVLRDFFVEERSKEWLIHRIKQLGFSVDDFVKMIDSCKK